LKYWLRGMSDDGLLSRRLSDVQWQCRLMPGGINRYRPHFPAGTETLGDLIKLTPRDLRVGRRSIEMIVATLADLGLSLAKMPACPHCGSGMDHLGNRCPCRKSRGHLRMVT
jgi:hypothetical protein